MVGTALDHGPAVPATTLTGWRRKVQRLAQGSLMLASVCGLIANCLVCGLVVVGREVVREERGPVWAIGWHLVAGAAAAAACFGGRRASLWAAWIRVLAVVVSLGISSSGRRFASFTPLWPAHVAEVTLWVVVASGPVSLLLHWALFAAEDGRQRAQIAMPRAC